ncbi:hypothetical protein SO694_00008145 [Aureococcus anophagefferens]|uniref:Uncharacterized protein n=1 Tax=Aureococcus anophagefferens TaxID=44056 RepID=A0ABR1GE67_AURAN
MALRVLIFSVLVAAGAALLGGDERAEVRRRLPAADSLSARRARLRRQINATSFRRPFDATRGGGHVAATRRLKLCVAESEWAQVAFVERMVAANALANVRVVTARRRAPGATTAVWTGATPTRARGAWAATARARARPSTPCSRRPTTSGSCTSTSRASSTARFWAERDAATPAPNVLFENDHLDEGADYLYDHLEAMGFAKFDEVEHNWRRGCVASSRTRTTPSIASPRALERRLGMIALGYVVVNLAPPADDPAAARAYRRLFHFLNRSNDTYDDSKPHARPGGRGRSWRAMGGPLATPRRLCDAAARAREAVNSRPRVPRPLHAPIRARSAFVGVTPANASSPLAWRIYLDAGVNAVYHVGRAAFGELCVSANVDNAWTRGLGRGRRPSAAAEHVLRSARDAGHAVV